MEDLGTVLGVWAHPDDEAYLSSLLMASAREAGSRVVVATATHGELGTPDPDAWPPKRLAELRRYELTASLAALGVGEHDHHWLGFADGECDNLPAAGTEAVARLLDEVQPDTIVTFGPDGMTGHADHRAVSAWTTAAWRCAGGPGRLLYATVPPSFHAEWGAVNDRIGLWQYGPGPVTDEADIALRIRGDEAMLDRKLVALRAHASQVSGLLAELGEETFRRWWSTEYFTESR
jgi:LmbE family N-acetylglucosaminyl deacetylase